MVNTTLGEFDMIRGAKRDWLYRKPDGPEFNQVMTATMTNTCALLFPQALIKQAGNMDDNYFMYYDDIDFVYRAVQSGAVVKYVPDAVIYHKESSSSGGQRVSSLKRYYNYRNLFYFMLKHQKSKLKLVIFMLYTFLRMSAITFYHALRGEFRIARAMWLGVIHCFQGKRGYMPVSVYS
jgi:GT2 family glycosyltransferase